MADTSLANASEKNNAFTKDTAHEEQEEQQAAIRATLSRSDISQNTREWLISRLITSETGREDIASLKYVESVGLELNRTEIQMRGEDPPAPKVEADPDIFTIFVSDPNTGKKLPVNLSTPTRVTPPPTHIPFQYSACGVVGAVLVGALERREGYAERRRSCGAEARRVRWRCCPCRWWCRRAR